MSSCRGLQLDRSIDGKYVLEDLCATACNSLYRRCDPEGQDPLYFFFDPSSYLEVEHDSFVFADDCSRILTHRRLIANLDPKWRPPYSPKASAISKSQTTKINIACNWSTVPDAKLVAGSANRTEDNEFSTIAQGFKLSVGTDDCKFTENLLSAVVKLDESPSTRWANETWHEVDLHLEGPEVFSKIRWMLSKIPDWDVLQQWSEVDSSVRPPSESTRSCRRECDADFDVNERRRSRRRSVNLVHLPLQRSSGFARSNLSRLPSRSTFSRSKTARKLRNTST